MKTCITFRISDTVKATRLIEIDELLRTYLTYVSDRKYIVETENKEIIAEISRKFSAAGIKHEFNEENI
jgi:hypothetical protein